MSGAEALALIGIISSTIQLVSFSSQVLRRIKDYKDDTTSLPREFWTLQDVHLNLHVATGIKD
jgi:hypothetical protein